MNLDETFIACINASRFALRRGEIEKEYVRALAPRPDITCEWNRAIEPDHCREGACPACELLGLDNDIATKLGHLAEDPRLERNLVVAQSSSPISCLP
jgi:hypothetical protein